MIASLLAVINPGDEIIISEPLYENYGPDTILAGATPRYVALGDPDFSIDRAELEAAFGPRTKAIISASATISRRRPSCSTRSGSRLPVPGSSFYHRAELGRAMLRFTFSKRPSPRRPRG